MYRLRVITVMVRAPGAVGLAERVGRAAARSGPGQLRVVAACEGEHAQRAGGGSMHQGYLAEERREQATCGTTSQAVKQASTPPTSPRNTVPACPPSTTRSPPPPPPPPRPPPPSRTRTTPPRGDA